MLRSHQTRFESQALLVYIQSLCGDALRRVLCVQHNLKCFKRLTGVKAFKAGVGESELSPFDVRNQPIERLSYDSLVRFPT